MESRAGTWAFLPFLFRFFFTLPPILSLFIPLLPETRRVHNVTHTKSHAIMRRYSNRPSDLDLLLPLLHLLFFLSRLRLLTRAGDYHWKADTASQITLLSFLRLERLVLSVSIRESCAKLFVPYCSDQFNCLNGTNA